MRRFAILIALIALLLPALPSSGAAARAPKPSFNLYRVRYEGSGTYSVQQSGEGLSGQDKADFHWKVNYAPLLVTSRRGSSVGTGAEQSHSSGGGEWSISLTNGEESCSKNGGLALGQGGGILGRVQRSGSLPLRLTPGSTDFTTTGGSSGSEACDTTDFWHDWVTNFSHVGMGELEDVDPLTAFVTLTPRELQAGKIIASVSNVTLAAPELTVDPDCGSGDGTSCRQTFSWTGRVTLIRSRSSGRHH